MMTPKAVTEAADEQAQDVLPAEVERTRPGPGGVFVGLASFGFILLQSACVAFMALSGLRLLVGIGSLAAATSAVRLMDVVHGAAFRLPMMVVATVGSLLNLYAVWRVRSLRARPASAWRLTPVTPRQVRSERAQILFAIVTLVLVAAELIGHAYQFGNPLS